jgi:hypothetical protein
MAGYPMATPPPGFPPGYNPGYNNVPPPMQQQQPLENGGLQTVLDEQLLQVTMAIEVVKLSAK